MKLTYQTKLLYPEILWERPVHYYKSKAGRLLLIAGSRGMAGAALLTSEAAFRSGTGILTLAFPEELKGNFTGILPEAMTLALPQTHSGSISKQAKNIILEQIKSIDVVIIGPGLSTNTETVQLIWELLPQIKKPTVIDADGLKAFAYGLEAIKTRKGTKEIKNYFSKLETKVILTPHPGEASKIMNIVSETKFKVNYIENHKANIASLINELTGATVVLKGHNTALKDSDPHHDILIDKVGGPELATAGSGDVLTGIIGSFLAQNTSKPYEAIATSIYLHSLAGQIAKSKLGERSVKASDIIRFLPEAIKTSETE